MKLARASLPQRAAEAARPSQPSAAAADASACRSHCLMAAAGDPKHSIDEALGGGNYQAKIPIIEKNKMAACDDISFRRQTDDSLFCQW